MRNNIINVIKSFFILHSSFDSVHYVLKILSNNVSLLTFVILNKVTYNYL